MKKQTPIFATLCLFVGLGMVPAYAQAFGFRARIPFSFVVLGRTLPAGEYLLTPAPHMLEIKDSNGSLIATVLANEIVGRSDGATGQIIFHCYSDRCFLSELRSRIQGEGRQVLPSRIEAELARKGQGQYFAVLGEKLGQ